MSRHPKVDRTQIAATGRVHAQSGLVEYAAERTITTGPLPDPATLERYVKVHPEAAKIVFDSWVAEQQHRRSIDERVLFMDAEAERRGQNYTLAIALGAIAASVGVAIATGSWAAAIVPTVLAGLPGVLRFVSTRPKPARGTAEPETPGPDGAGDSQ